MKSLHNFHNFLFVSLLFVSTVCAQEARTAAASDGSKAAAEKRGPIFRANKDQVNAAQAKLKTKGIYTGEATGKLDDATRAALKSFQKESGLNPTGTLNRATLEKMSIELTEQQKQIPIPESSYAKAGASGSNGDKPARSVFRATKEQISEAQRRLKTGGMYVGDETGKLDDTTREGLKKYQEANGLRVTGTLNQVTLEKMGVALTDRQKGGTEGPK
jgi:peptidoglycan hydrolase-like protein with peptidoglycan-binding domain